MRGLCSTLRRMQFLDVLHALPGRVASLQRHVRGYMSEWDIGAEWQFMHRL